MKITKAGETGKTFDSVELRDAIVDDLVQAERVAGQAQGMLFVAALLSQVGTFDGKKLPVEELRGMRAADFLSCLSVLELELLMESATAAFTSAGKDASASAT